MSPLLILAVGIAVVLGMIIFFRINAFIALITAAIAVSLLAPGAVEGKIARVADAFGRSAGSIGIVIALAAVIGQCMMDSGAADRIVRTFLKLLGEKRAPLVLMGSGFVLAVPVFFDTVFYLLVPLARSLFRRTKKNYLLYILAISAGAAITHTLVPPTPGPLLMAATLGVDIGLMILVGGLVAVPAALAGIAFSVIVDRKMNIPMRQAGNLPDPEPLEESQLPTVFASLLPIALPVVLISCHTVVESTADAERPGQLQAGDIQDWTALADGLSSTPAGQRIQKALTAASGPTVAASPSEADKAAIIAGLNQTLANRNLFPRDLPSVDDADARRDYFAAQQAFSSVLPQEWEAVRAQHDSSASIARADRVAAFYQLRDSLAARTKPVVVERMNRLLLESLFPDAVRLHVWDTPWRKLSHWTALAGNANLALLLAMATSLIVYIQQRRPTMETMARSVEGALMSGGAIILITSAGGAFGSMLQTAQVGSAIQNLFGAVGGGEGLFYLYLGFGMAALIKVAQGSSTTAMIVVSGMLAPTVANVDLPFNVVYVATAIGTGSLAGAWMNDSGFWIVAKMSGLTETEALKSWKPMLLVLSIVGMTATLVLATVMPLAN